MKLLKKIKYSVCFLQIWGACLLCSCGNKEHVQRIEYDMSTHYFSKMRGVKDSFSAKLPTKYIKEAIDIQGLVEMMDRGVFTEEELKFWILNAVETAKLKGSIRDQLIKNGTFDHPDLLKAFEKVAEISPEWCLVEYYKFMMEEEISFIYSDAKVYFVLPRRTAQNADEVLDSIILGWINKDVRHFIEWRNLIEEKVLKGSLYSANFEEFQRMNRGEFKVLNILRKSN